MFFCNNEKHDLKKDIFTLSKNSADFREKLREKNSFNNSPIFFTLH